MYVDFITLLDDWVEQGKAPADTQVLTDMDPTPPFKVNASLPMCRYPMFPRYNGTGDAKQSAGYTCTARELALRRSALLGLWLKQLLRHVGEAGARRARKCCRS
jgi:hypothetical protein